MDATTRYQLQTLVNQKMLSVSLEGLPLPEIEDLAAEAGVESGMIFAVITDMIKELKDMERTYLEQTMTDRYPV